jgi:hypothetical protein
MSDKKNSLISNVNPPSELPSFVLRSSSPQNPTKIAENLDPQEENPNSPKFSPAIPLEKNTALAEKAQKLNLNENESVPQADEITAQQEFVDALTPITQGTFTYFKFAIR